MGWVSRFIRVIDGPRGPGKQAEGEILNLSARHVAMGSKYKRKRRDLRLYWGRLADLHLRTLRRLHFTVRVTGNRVASCLSLLGLLGLGVISTGPF